MRRKQTQVVLLGGVAFVALGLVLVAWLGPQSVERQQILMGTFVQVKAYGSDPEVLQRAVAAALAEVARVEATFSRAGPGALGALNRAPEGVGVPLPEEVWQLLARAQHIGAQSGGAFDVTLGGLSDLWGFVEDWDGTGQVPSTDEIQNFLTTPRGLELLADDRARRLGAATQIDLGAIAKGYAVDRAVAVLRAYAVQAGLVNAGGNVRVFGQVPEPFLFWTVPRPFQIGVQHPRDPGNVLGGLVINGDLGVATTGDYQRYFMVEGQRYHHVLDPRTGRPALGLISSTVVAPTATDADALSTATFVMGARAGLALVESMPGVEAVLVDDDGRVWVSSGLDPARFRF